mmetsp:Transcript_34076/g.98172  ORF Transcript_34076/g.98172 Transcript_34076/m.98172 type:complete len:99 (-) Transcript_34076:553-849(-)
MFVYTMIERESLCAEVKMIVFFVSVRPSTHMHRHICSMSQLDSQTASQPSSHPRREASVSQSVNQSASQLREVARGVGKSANTHTPPASECGRSTTAY